MTRALGSAVGVWLAATIAGCGGGSLDTGRAGASGSIAGRGGQAAGASSGTTGGGAISGGGAFSGTLGSIAGNRGVGAIGGAGAFAGAGATGGVTGGGEPCPFLQSPVCGREACGNGRRDTCLSPFGPGCMLGQVTEVCDLGDAPSYMTCGELGYASGAAGCAADCSGIDISACHECFPLQSPVVGCGTVPLDRSTTPPQIGLAATDAEVGLVWLDTTPQGTQSVGFAQLAPDLTPIRSRVLERFPEPLLYAAPAVGGVAVAPIPTGWVVAVADSPNVYLHVLDAQGQVVARTTVDAAASDYSSANIPVLIPRPGGGPLILWYTRNGTRAAVIAADGRSVSAVSDLPNNVSFGNGAWVQGAFTVVFQERNVGTSVKALRVDGAGQVMSIIELFAGDGEGLVGAAVGADGLRVIIQEQMLSPPYASMLFFQRFTAAGEPVTERKMIIYGDGMFGSAVHAVARGADTTVLFSEAGALRHGRVTSDGDLQPAAQAIAQGPYGLISPSAVTSRGSDVVVAWTAYDPGATPYESESPAVHVGMARLAP